MERKRFELRKLVRTTIVHIFQGGADFEKKIGLDLLPGCGRSLCAEVVL